MDEKILVLIISIIAYLGIYIYSVRTLKTGEESIFKGSGEPSTMARILLTAFVITVRYFIGILIISLLCLLILSQAITAEAGLPVLSAVVGYLLGKSVEEVISVTKKENENSEKIQKPSELDDDSL